jgi:hypothetical protein
MDPANNNIRNIQGSGEVQNLQNAGRPAAPEKLGQADKPLETKPKFNLDVGKTFKSVGKMLWDHKVHFAGLAVTGAGAAVMLSFMFVPGPNIALLLGGALLASAGLTILVTSPIINPSVDKGVTKGAQLLADAGVTDKFTEKADALKHKLEELAAQFCYKLSRSVERQEAT